MPAPPRRHRTNTMIHFNTKPGFFQSWPILGWDRDTLGRPVQPQRSRMQHIKMIVDASYDSAEAEKVKTLAEAFQELFKGEHVVGPDGEPMKLGEFAKLEVEAPMIKAGVPNANGDIYPKDVLGRAISMGCSVRHDSCPTCESNDNVIRERKRLKRRLCYLCASLVGSVAVIAFEVAAAWLGQDFLLEWIVANICQVW